MKPALFAAAALAAFATPLAAAGPAEPASPTDVATQQRFSVEVVGEGGRDAILIPGLLSPRSVWDGQIETLTRAGYRVHLVQVNGFGGTDAVLPSRWIVMAPGLWSSAACDCVSNSASTLASNSVTAGPCSAANRPSRHCHSDNRRIVFS